MEWLRENLPGPVLDALPWLGIASIVMFAVTPFVAWWIVLRLPEDFFVQKDDGAPPTLVGRVRAALRTVLGALLVLAGIAMLVLPGQGILTILIGLLIMRFPGRDRLVRSLVSNLRVQRSLNALRARSGRAPLRFPGSGAFGAGDAD